MPEFKETVDFDAEVVRTTDNALLLNIEDEGRLWIPKSQICETSELKAEADVGDEGTVTLSEWIAIQKGLV